MGIDDVAGLLAQYSFCASSEAELQVAVEEALATVAFERECFLSPESRIEFFVPEAKVGVECKIDGSTTAVMRQLLRYAESPKIDGLVLLTTRNKHKSVPPALNGKAIRVILARAF